MKTNLVFIFFALLITAFMGINASASSNQPEKEGGKSHSPSHIAEKMSALFPQPQPDYSQQVRPTKPELTSPQFYSIVQAGNTTLTWKPSEGAETYHVQVATDANFKWIVSESFEVKGNSYDLPVESGKSYYWRVLGAKMSNFSQFTKSPFSSSMFQVK